MANNLKSVKINNEELLEIFGEMASVFQRTLPIENTISITDTEKFIYHFKGEESQGIDVIGKPFPPKSDIPDILKTGVSKVKVMPKELFGVGFKSSTSPIKNSEGNIIGTLNIALSLKSQDALQEVTENISSSSEQLTATTEELASSSVQLFDNTSDVLVQTKEITTIIEQTNSILDFVNHIATNSRLLGLNAAIEAARAGEHGRGFSVVADEIGKMAEGSVQSVKDIKKLTSSINDKINHLLMRIQELSDIAQNQAAATEEISASIQNLASTTQTLRQVSEVI